MITQTKVKKLKEPYAVTVKRACRLTGLGRTKIFEMLGDGRLRRVKVDNRTLVTVDSIKALFAAPFNEGQA